MPYEIISTGSCGNSILFNNNILLDIGLPFKTLKKYLKGVDLIFVSHRHCDHLNSKCAKLINFNYPKINFICNKEVANKLIELGIKKKNIWVLEEGKWYELGFAKVRLEKLEHDAHNSSFQIEYRGGYKMIYITDTGNIGSNINAKNYDLYFIEKNYKNDEELDKLIQQDYDMGREYSHYIRVRTTHLSEEQAFEWLENNMGDNSEFEFIHMSMRKEMEK